MRWIFVTLQAFWVIYQSSEFVEFFFLWNKVKSSSWLQVPCWTLILSSSWLQVSTKKKILALFIFLSFIHVVHADHSFASWVLDFVEWNPEWKAKIITRTLKDKNMYIDNLPGKPWCHSSLRTFKLEVTSNSLISKKTEWVQNLFSKSIAWDSWS